MTKGACASRAVVVRGFFCALLLGLLGLLVACGSSGPKREPASLQPIPDALGLGQAWRNSAGSRVEFPQQIGAADQTLAVAVSTGTLTVDRKSVV